MAKRYRYYPPEIVDWDDKEFAGQRDYVYICYPVCCPNPNCYPRFCVPRTNYVTCCPNPNSMYYGGGQIVTACSPECSPECNPSTCNPRYCSPRTCSPRACNPRYCSPRACNPRD